MPAQNHSISDLGDDKEQRLREEPSSNIKQGAERLKLSPIKVPENQKSNKAKMIDDFLQNAKVFAWDNQDHCEQATDYFSAFETILQPNKHSDVFFHFIETYLSWEEPKVIGFVNWIGNGPYRALLTNKQAKASNQEYSETPLIRAIVLGKAHFAAALLKVDGITVNTLYKVNGYGTCLHQAIKKESPLIKLMVEKSSVHPDLFLEKDKDGNNVLHLLMQTRGDELLVSRLECIVGLRKKIDSADARGDEGTTSEPDTETDDDESKLRKLEFRKLKFRLEVLSDVINSLRVLKESPLQVSNEKDLTPYQLRVSTLKTSKRVLSVLDKISDPNRVLNFQEKKMRKKVSLVKLQEQAIRKIIDADPIADLIRRFCIRKFKNSQECSRALYKPGNGKQYPD
jgi:hypothetical protein